MDAHMVGKQETVLADKSFDKVSALDVMWVKRYVYFNPFKQVDFVLQTGD